LKNSTLDDFLPNPIEVPKGDAPGQQQKKSDPILSSTPLTPARAGQLFSREASRFKSIDRQDPKLEIYRYSTIKYTIREKQDHVLFKICDIYLLASEMVFRAFARKMLRHYLDRKNTESDEDLYRCFVEHEQVSATWKRIRMERRTGKRFLDPVGQEHDLMLLAIGVADRYFPDDFILPRLGWSLVSAKRRFGHYDSEHNMVIVSKALDTKNVPTFVIEYILYHEFLHIKHGAVRKGNRTWVHTREFHNEERRFEDYKKAKKFLKELAGGKG